MAEDFELTQRFVLEPKNIDSEAEYEVLNHHESTDTENEASGLDQSATDTVITASSSSPPSSAFSDLKLDDVAERWTLQQAQRARSRGAEKGKQCVGTSRSPVRTGPSTVGREAKVRQTGLRAQC